jgi:flagellar L-ring protein precursor FlgH
MKHPCSSVFICVPLLWVAACSSVPGHVKFPEAPKAAPLQVAQAPAPVATPTGGIYNSATYRPMFEDIRARQVGDIITIALNEKSSASRKASSTTGRTGSASVGVGDMLKLPLKSLQGMKFDGSSDQKFDGKGETASEALLQGTITATVVQVLPNGNLVVAGEKQIGVNSNVERLRVTGVVHPSTIVAGNTVSSTQVADARIEVSGSGILDETQTMGWAQRIFMSVLPL